MVLYLPMGSASHREDPDRVFVKNGRRHYRRRYSSTEVGIGMGVLGILALVVAWIAWQGANPDPELFASQADLLTGTSAAADRGPLPEALVAPGWIEGPVSRFDTENLYEKINGREGYYKSFGFEMLTFVSLSDPEDPTRSVDIEAFDLGNAANALGAYAGERPAEITPVQEGGVLSHVDRNALYMTRGRLYVRAIGSEESSAVLEQLEKIRAAFQAGEAESEEALSPAYDLFVKGMGLDPGRVAYVAENAFSFGFARDVYTVLLDDDETEIFVVATDSPEAAEALTAEFNRGFEGYGQALAGSGTIPWIEDRYIGTLAGAHSSGSWVIGVRGAPSLTQAEEALSGLDEAVAALQ